MRMLTYVFETALSFSEPVSEHSFILRCMPKSTNTQKVMESQVYTDPRITLTEQIDGFGNRVVVGYCSEPHNTFNFFSSGVAMVSSEDAGPEPAHPMFLAFTELTQPSEAIREMAEEVARESGFGELPEGPEQIQQLTQALNTRVYESFEYTPGATNTHTTAAEAFAGGRGVCQDYSQVLISACRSLGIPARYVTGLMEGEGVSHAWTEVHDGIRWRGLDPTNNRVVNDDYLMFSTGRDFEDCPIERGVFRGSATQAQEVKAALGTDAAATSANW